MNSSSPSKPRLKAPPSFLFRGPPGGGKSTFAMQFPGVWFADIDLNLSGPERHLKGNYKFDTITLDDNGNAIVDKSGAYDWPAIWLRCKTKTLEAIKDPEVKIICLDGLTQLDNILVQKILREQDKAIMEIQYWIPFRNELMKLVMYCRHSAKPMIITSHEVITVDIQGVVTGKNLAVSSRLKDVLGGLFTDIYAFDSQPGANGSRKFIVSTGPDGVRKDVKTSFPEMPTKLDVTENGFAKLNKWMQLS